MKILAIGAHSDDVEIGMGGTIKRFSEEGHDVLILDCITPCEDIDGIHNKTRKKAREVESYNAAEILGAKRKLLDMNPYDFTFNRKYVKIIDDEIKLFNPEMVFVDWIGDSHQDHFSIAKIVIAALRKNRCSLLMYQPMTPGGITNENFSAQYYVDISKYMDYKIESMKAYNSQDKIYNNWDESARGLAVYRGYEIGVKYAEAFEVVKLINYLE